MHKQKGTDIQTATQTELDKVLHRQIFALHIEVLTPCHMCTHFKSKITTYTLRLSVFYRQSRLITEPVQVESGQFNADL